MTATGIAHNKIIAKLQALDEYLGYLKELQKINKKSFLQDYHQFGLAEHYLHLSIEVLLDVSKLIIIAYGLPRPEEPREVFYALHNEGVINDVQVSPVNVKNQSILRGFCRA